MGKYEYKQFTAKTKGTVAVTIEDTFITQLNDLGKDGWSLVQAVPLAIGYGRTTRVTFVMRRETSA